MGLLIDTQSIVWAVVTPERLGTAALAAIRDREEQFFVSAATAFEYADLNLRGRFGGDLPLGPILTLLDATVLPLPAETWRLIDALPRLHRDPVDRMMIAHAMYADLAIVTADETIRKYPVRTVW